MRVKWDVLRLLNRQYLLYYLITGMLLIVQQHRIHYFY